jgi:hypothetical protein
MDRNNPLMPLTRFERFAEAMVFVVVAFCCLLVLQAGLYLLVQVPTAASGDQLLTAAIGITLSFAALYVGRRAIWRVIFSVRGGSKHSV